MKYLTELTFCSPRDSFQLKLPELRPFFSFSVTFFGVINSTNSKSARFAKYFFRTTEHFSCRFRLSDNIALINSGSVHLLRLDVTYKSKFD